MAMEESMQPFLLEFAEVPVSDQEHEVKDEDGKVVETVEIGPMHTRCGHPRHRDD